MKRKRNYKSLIERKEKKAKIKNKNRRGEIQKQIKDHEQGATYGTGVTLETII